MPKRTRSDDELTKRQHQVLAYIADGLTQRQIAKVLWIKEQTVRTHTVQLKKTLRAQTTAHAVSLGYQAGLLPAEAGLR